MKATKVIEIDVPEVPGDVHITGGLSYETVHIGELSDGTLTQLASEWAAALFAKAAEQRKAKEPEADKEQVTV